MIFLMIICCFALGTAWLWRISDRVMRRLPRARLWRWVIGIFYAGLLVFLIVPILRTVMWNEEVRFPTPIFVTAAYLWYPVLLPISLSISLFWVSLHLLRRRQLRKRESAAAITAATEPTVPPAPQSAPAGMTRRQMFRAAAAALPPITTCSLTVASLVQRGDFRVRSLTISIPNLPEDLDGLTIAQLSDLHAGNFLPPETISQLIEQTNRLAADFVVFTGDLIDRGQFDHLPEGLRLLREINPRNGLVIIEGNHDLLDDSDRFEGAMAEFGDHFITEGQKVLDVPSKRDPSKRVKVQFLGIPWGERKEDEVLTRKRVIRMYSEEYLADSVRRVAAMRKPEALDPFPILLAHHPHAFDTAAECRLPLTLSGHTHGGQIMLTENIGAGPLRFRYWAGVHERDGCQLVINNGIGAWYPLRVNAPAEILHLTLRRR